MALDTSLRATISAKLTSPQDLGSAVATAEKALSFALASGTGAGQADKVFADTRTLAASATEDLDLAGPLLDPLGAAITLLRVKAVIVVAASTNTNNVVVGAGVNPWATLLSATGTVTLRPGAAAMFMAGSADATAYAVTAGTGDVLKVANSGAGTSVTYDVVVVGASA